MKKPRGSEWTTGSKMRTSGMRVGMTIIVPRVSLRLASYMRSLRAGKPRPPANARLKPRLQQPPGLKPRPTLATTFWVREPERPELPVEIRALDAERLRGVGDAAVVLGDNGGDVLALEALPRIP